MIKIGKLLAIFFILNIICLNLFSAQVQLDVQVNPTKVGVGDQVQVVLTVLASDEVNIEDPQAPKSENLKLIQAEKSGLSQSTQIQIINGQTEYKKTISQSFVFLYQAVKSGAFTLPGFNIKVDGRQLRSESKSLIVLKESQAQKQQNRGRPKYDDDPFADDDEDPFMQLFKQQRKMLEDQLKQQGFGGRFGGGFGGGGSGQQIEEKKLPHVNTNEAFFVYLDTDKNEAYEGEQITANWYLYVRGEMTSLDRAKFPDLKGFWKEIIEEIPSLQFYSEIVNGVMYKKALLASHALFPIKAGISAIDEFKIKAKVATPTQFGIGQPYEYTKASRRKEIKVLPLPIDGRPISFSGAVGEFQIQAQVEGSSFPMGQPFSLKVRFEGMGNAKLIDLPPIEWPQNLEVYDTKSESKFFKEGNSFKEFEVLLIPKSQGKILLPQINFSYFDPAQKKYITKSTEAFEINVTEPLKGNQAQGQSFAQAEIKEEKVLLPVLDIKQNMISFKSFESQALVYSLIAVVMCILQFLMFLIKYLKISTVSALLERIEIKVKTIDQLVKRKDYKNLGIESINLFYILLSGITHQDSNDQNWQFLLTRLPQHLRENHEQKLKALYDYFQVLGYAPEEMRLAAINPSEVEKNISQLKALTSELKIELK